MSCSGPTVQTVGNGIEFVLTVDREVGAFGQILAKQFVGVLAGPALPGAMWITEVDVHADGGKLLMPRHFFALVVGKALRAGSAWTRVYRALAGPRWIPCRWLTDAALQSICMIRVPTRARYGMGFERMHRYYPGQRCLFVRMQVCPGMCAMSACSHHRCIASPH